MITPLIRCGVVLRMHLTFEDLGALRIADQAQRGAEVLFSLNVLQTRSRDLRFHRWLRSGRRSAGGALLAELFAPSLLPGYLAPAVSPDWTETRSNALRSDPDARRADIKQLTGFRAVTPFARALAGDDAEARRLFAWALSSYQRHSMDAWMAQIDALMRTERDDWARLAAGGADRLLSSLHPRVYWKPPVLHMDSALDADYHLGGCGLLIQPTYFGAARPWLGSTDTPHPQPVLFVPLRKPLPLGEHEPVTPENLVRLLGRTRATILSVLTDEGPTSTGSMARRLDCSPSTVSSHTEVLRESGLITTVRDGQSVRHAATDLGIAVRRGRG